MQTLTLDAHYQIADHCNAAMRAMNSAGMLIADHLGEPSIYLKRLDAIAAKLLAWRDSLKKECPDAEEAYLPKITGENVAAVISKVASLQAYRHFPGEGEDWRRGDPARRYDGPDEVDEVLTIDDILHSLGTQVHGM